MGTRRKGRECALQILYQAETEAGIANLGDKKSGQKDVTNMIMAFSSGNVMHVLEAFFANFESKQEVHDYAASLVRGTINNIQTIDGLISKNSPRWKLSRMSKVDRNLLRLATYELKYATDLSDGIVIDEAIEIAKRYGTENSGAFVNGVLDSVAKELKSKSV